MNAATDDLLALGVLAEPQRARIYAHLADVTQSCTRQEVCEALGMGRTLVTFHLDKLERAGLVRSHRAAAPAGGRGRPPQRYTVSDRELIVTMPPRRYEVLAEVLVCVAREQALGEPLQAAATKAGKRRGVELAQAEREAGDGRSVRQILVHLLTRLGYQPRQDGEELVLTNCPFQRLRTSDTELVCSINAALGAGYLEGLAMSDDVTTRLRPCPDNCCVVFEPTDS
jgi:predicted ArsR family transcriptional regulator